MIEETKVEYWMQIAATELPQSARKYKAGNLATMTKNKINLPVEKQADAKAKS